MDLGDITQLTLLATTALVIGRIGWSLARLIDRRGSRPHPLADGAAERLRALAHRVEDHDLVERALVTLSTPADETLEAPRPASGT